MTRACRSGCRAVRFADTASRFELGDRAPPCMSSGVGRCHARSRRLFRQRFRTLACLLQKGARAARPRADRRDYRRRRRAGTRMRASGASVGRNSGSARAVRSAGGFMSLSKRARARKSTPSMRPPFAPAQATTASRDFAQTIIRIITVPSCSIPTATTSRRCVARPEAASGRRRGMTESARRGSQNGSARERHSRHRSFGDHRELATAAEPRRACRLRRRGQGRCLWHRARRGGPRPWPMPVATPSSWRCRAKASRFAPNARRRRSTSSTASRRGRAPFISRTDCGRCSDRRPKLPNGTRRSLAMPSAGLPRFISTPA